VAGAGEGAEERAGQGAEAAARMSWRASGGVAWLDLDDGKANAMSRAWLADLDAALSAVEADPAIRVLVIRGRPGFFSGGLDLTELPHLPPDELRGATDAFIAAMRRVFLLPRPVVAASTGHAIAGGMMLYLAADLRLALDRPDARYGLNEATNGIPLLGATAGICQYGIPPAHHTELILHGRMLGARETLERGITHALCEDPAALAAEARARAEALLAVEPAAYAVNKRLLREPIVEQATARAEALRDQAPSGNVFRGLSRA